MVGGDETVSATDEGRTPASSPGRPGDEGELQPTILIDRYQIERRLGAGGMGVVYAARDIHLGRAVAVKLVGSRIEPGSGQGGLVREAQAMAKLRHPNIAAVYDIGVSVDRLFVVMELIDGGTVADWLKAERRSWREIVGVYLQAARGLAAAHAAGFVHRDFKPENVLLGNDGVARVSDFGVARILGDADGAADVVGTAGYIAPEILRHEPVDGRADQFSFCVAVYAALHGERPFEGPKRIAETLGKLRPPPAGIVPRWLQRIITRGLAPDPRDRWPTIAALAAAIERRLGRRRRGLVLTLLGATAVAATAMVMVTPRTPAPPPHWSPVMLERESKDSPLRMAVSRNGSTLVSYSLTEAWVAPRVGAGARRHVALPFPGTVGMCKLSRTGDRLFCSFGTGPEGRSHRRGEDVGAKPQVPFEIWAIDVATGQAECRVPASAAPPLLPGVDFDVGPEESIVFGVVDGSAVWRVDRTGAIQQVVTAERGHQLEHNVWSPDGSRIAYSVVSPDGNRIAVMNTATRTVAVVSRRRCHTITWLTENSLACAPLNFRRPLIIELLLPTGAGEATERVRYNGPEYQQLIELYTSSAGLLIATKPFELHMALLALDAPAKMRRISSGGITDLPAAGWTSSGALIFGASVQGQLRIMRMLPDGVVETVRTGPASEVPLVVLGDTILFGRFPGGEGTLPFIEPPIGRRYPDDGELFRLNPDGALEPLGKTRGFMNLICAGGRATPCLLQERSGEDAIAIEWDAETGARGRPRARWSMTSYTGKSTLSHDGRTLAQVRRYLGKGEISLLDLETGHRRSIAVPETAFTFTSWQPDGTLLANALSGNGSGIVRVRDAGTIEMVAVVPPRDEPWAFAGELRVTPDGKTAAILMGEALRTYWWIPRSED